MQRPARPASRWWLGAILLGVTGVAVAVEVAMSLRGMAVAQGRNDLEHFVLLTVLSSFVLSGTMVVVHRSRSAVGWVLAAITFHPPVLFPDGRLPSPRRRPVAWLVNGALAALVLMAMTAPVLDGVDADVAIDNPIGSP